LRALPLTGFRYFEQVVRTVSDDTTVRIDHSWYAARPAAIGSLVVVRVFDSTIEVRDRQTQALLRIHPRFKQPGQLLLPEDERPFNPSRQTAFLLSAAGDIGPQTKALCQRMFDSEGRVGQRAMWGIVGLAKKYPARIVEQACSQAFEHRLRSYKKIRGLVERLFDQALERLSEAPQLALPLTQDHALIRPAAEYGELFNLGAQQQLTEPSLSTGETNK